MVYAVNYPLAYFARCIGGGEVTVEFPVPGDVDPAYWSPDDETIVAYQGADLILLNGATYARWTQRVSLPPSRLVDTSASFADRLIPMDDAVTHAHGPEGDHEHTDTAFTTWLDPTLAIEHARAIASAMVGRWPEHRASFEKNFGALEADLQRLDERLARAATGRSEVPLLGSHPVYQYLARRYGLNMRSVHFEPDETPDAGQWRRLDALLEEHPATWMLWEATPDPAVEEALAERGVRCAVFEPCGSTPPDGDYFQVMMRNAEALEKALAVPGG
jgi:zinc transport system substrate-binding protein